MSEDTVLSYVSGYLGSILGSTRTYSSEELMQKIEFLSNYIESNYPVLTKQT